MPERQERDDIASKALAAADRFYDSFLEGDVSAVERATADDYLQTDVNGNLQDKQAWLREYYLPLAEDTRAGRGWDVFDRHVDAVRRIGEVIVLTGSLRIRRTGSERPPRTLRFTQVWMQQDGRWLRAAAHNAWLPQL